MEKLGSRRTDFHNIWHTSIFQKSVEVIQISLKSENNNGYVSNDTQQCTEQLRVDKVAKTNQSTEVHGNINKVCLLHVSATHKCIEQLDKVAKTNESTKVNGNINTVCLLRVSTTHKWIEQLDKVAKTNKSTEVHGNINTVCLLHV